MLHGEGGAVEDTGAALGEPPPSALAQARAAAAERKRAPAAAVHANSTDRPPQKRMILLFSTDF